MSEVTTHKADGKFREVMNRAGAVPYRVGGRLRVAYTPGTPQATLDAMREAVRKMGERLGPGWAEPDRATKDQWAKAGLLPMDVGDEPPPPDVNLETCDAGWLVARCERYHFTLGLKADGSLEFRPHEGWTMVNRKDRHGNELPGTGVNSLIPRWFLDVCKRRKADLIGHLRAGGEYPPAENGGVA